MPLLGAHMSIAGGYHKAVDAAAALGMDCVQIFTKNNNQWRAKPLSDEDVGLFREALERTGVREPCAHDSYLINLASPADELWRKSLEAFVVELERAEALGLKGLVMHPGSYTTTDEEAGLQRIVRALDEALDRTAGQSVEIWLENTAGQGTNLGHRFEHLRYLIDNVQDAGRIGACIDSCHLLAAGYPLVERADYLATMKELDRVLGLDRVRAFHLNDSKRELGSRVDRHAHIGQGCLGREAFRHIVNDRRFRRLPMYLETPKGEREGANLDAINLAALRGLVEPRPARRPKAVAAGE
ncbi:MAG: deoxyribonuclease IV [Planctomycetales bacterium]